MIKVEELTKRFAGITALDKISFEVSKGEIVGFLGPNGAGKTTTMRILSCFLPPTSGRVEVAGYDVFTDSLKARERIGYMPENVPLYTEMRVIEYLRYRGILKGILRRRLKERVSDVVELCGLSEVATRLISTLSKGYRQRVGLADAMLHEPDLLILDEPTIGLDPNQVRHVRELIRNLGRHHTILLSTHILSEVEATCSRVMIIDKGRIEASDKPENLRACLRMGNDVRVSIKTVSPEPVAACLRSLTGVRSVRWTQEGDWAEFVVLLTSGEDPREAIYHLAVSERWILRELTCTQRTLEDVFAEITHAEP